jgi:G:T/U-mismatch repair DNA glycosylase/8-oxo-dGTP pyrophosphatase MutT (NUDIX family)
VDVHRDVDVAGAALPPARAHAYLSSDVPDVLAPGLACVFCGINPGRVSAAAHAHFANPRNDFWRLLHDAGFTPRLYEPAEQFALLELGYGVTNAAYRTTPGSGDLRRGDFDGERLRALAAELRPRALAFVGKEAYRGVFGERAELGPQRRTLEASGLFVLPSTSPANAAVPYSERLRSFRELHAWLEPEDRRAVRAVVVDREGRVLLLRWENGGVTWWITPGGGCLEGEAEADCLRRELVEEIGLRDPEVGPLVLERTHVLPWDGRLYRQHERFFAVRAEAHEVVPAIDLEPEHLYGHRWWTRAELERTEERISPPRLTELLHAL